MALNGIGGSPLEKFQQARDLARKKIDTDDSRFKLADLLQQKQAEIGGIDGKPAPKAKPSSSRAQAKAASAFPGGADARQVSGPAAYGRAGNVDKGDPKPRLGRYIDFMA